MNPVVSRFQKAFLYLCLIAVCFVPSGCSDSSAQEKNAAKPMVVETGKALQARIDNVLRFTREERTLRVDNNAAWQLLHGVLAYGKDFEVDAYGERVALLPWILDGGMMRGWGFVKGPAGVRAVEAPGSKVGQGHPDQWLAIISQCNVPLSQTIRSGGQEFTLEEVLKQMEFDTYYGKECSWTLIALSQYVHPTDQTWIGSDGREWNLERIVDMEAGPEDDAAGKEHIYTAACGGTHRLIGMQMALNAYRKDKPNATLHGGWAKADRRIHEAILAIKKTQLPSGAFSSSFVRPIHSRDPSELINSTGHALEFLSLALSQEELNAPWVRRAVVALCKLMEATRDIEYDCGPLYHAAHALKLYRDRSFGSTKEMVKSE